MIIMLYTEIESQGETASPYPVRSRRAEELTRLPASGPQSLHSPPGGNAVTIIVVCGLTKSVPFWKQTLSLGQYALFGCPKIIGCFLLPNYQVLVPNHQPATLSSPHRCFSSFCPVIKVHRILSSLHFPSAKSGHTPSSSTPMEQCPMIASLAGVCIFGHRSSFSEPRVWLPQGNSLFLHLLVYRSRLQSLVPRHLAVPWLKPVKTQGCCICTWLWSFYNFSFVSGWCFM